jgi:hypothetical protein
MSRRDFTYLNSEQVAQEITDLVAAAIARDARFPSLRLHEFDLLFADTRREIELGLDEFLSGNIEDDDDDN